MNNNNGLLVPMALLGAALIISAFIMAAAWRNHSNVNQTITVTGSAKREIVSDLGILRGTITGNSSSADAAFKSLKNQKPALYAYLAEQGFPENTVTLYTIVNNPIFETSLNGNITNNVIGYSYSQRFEIQSKEVQKIRQISLDIASLVERGVSLTVESPEYYYTNLAQLKIDIQAEAARDASVRAEKIAESTGRDLGALSNARMGVLQITPKNSTEISDYGVNDVSSIVKEITAVVNASFRIN